MIFSALVIPLFIKKLFRRQKSKGFSLVGVMVASSIGLIVVGGMTQILSNMSSQVRLMENRAELRNLTTLLEKHLQDMGACYRTLNTTAIRSFMYSGGTAAKDFLILKDSSGNPVIDLSDTANMESRFGLTGHVRFRLQCGSATCKDCNTASNWGPVSGMTGNFCQNQWNISLISQGVTKGVHVFNKPQDLVNLHINFKTQGDDTDWNCGGISIGTLVTPILDCITLDGSNQRTLVGCGNTQKNTANFATSFGFNTGTTGSYNTFIGINTGHKNTTGEDNTFVGHNTGFNNTGGKYNTFMGRNAGFYNTTGFYNTFVGHNAGVSNTTGGYNTFVGYQAGYSNKGLNSAENTFIGYQAGRSNTSGGENTFIGYRAGYSNIWLFPRICG